MSCVGWLLLLLSLQPDSLCMLFECISLKHTCEYSFWKLVICTQISVNGLRGRQPRISMSTFEPHLCSFLSKIWQTWHFSSGEPLANSFGWFVLQQHHPEPWAAVKHPDSVLEFCAHFTPSVRNDTFRQTGISLEAATYHPLTPTHTPEHSVSPCPPPRRPHVFRGT